MGQMGKGFFLGYDGIHDLCFSDSLLVSKVQMVLDPGNVTILHKILFQHFPLRSQADSIVIFTSLGIPSHIIVLKC